MTVTSTSVLTRLFGLAGKIIVVTGASMGIGRGIALRLAELGAHVVVTARKLPAALAVAQEIEERGGLATALALDVDDEDSVLAVFGEIGSRFGGVDVLVNNAGVFPETSLLETTAAAWEAIHRTNACGTFLCLREAAKLMKARGQGGRIVNISSNASIRSSVSGRFAYNASKAAVNRLTQEAALELAPHDILVNAVLPGPVATEKLDLLDAPHPELRDAIARKIPVGRWGTADDIAAAVIYFSSAASSFSTGQTLVVDGGAMLA